MNYTTETVNTQFINQTFVDKIYSGHIKEAMDAASTFVRLKLREEGFARKIFTPQMVTSADLDRDLTDQPRIIVEKEPDSIASSFALSAKPEIRYFKGARYEVSMHKVSSNDFRKSKYELATYKSNIQQILQENSVKDIQKQEDANLVTRLKGIAVDFANSGNYGIQSSGAAGFGIKTLMKNVKVLANNEQKPGKILMPYGLYLDLITRRATMIGSPAATEHLRGAGLDTFYGFQIVTTNKAELLTSATPNAPGDQGTEGVGENKGDMVIIFAPEAYLGQFYSLQEPTVFLKTEADMIEFQTYEAVGVGIGNNKGFVIADFNLDGTDPDV